MKFRSFFVYALFLSCLFAVSADSALAAYSRTNTSTTSTEASDAIKGATVNIYCRLKVGKKMYSSSGSGVFLSERGVILTNAHVAQYFLLSEEKGKVTGRCAVRTGSPAQEQYTADVLYFPAVWIKENASELINSEPKATGENDFALLYVTDAKKGALPRRFPALEVDMSGGAEQDPVTITGYPTGNLNFDGIRKKLNAVTATSTVTNTHNFRQSQSVDRLTVAPSAAGSSGVSGGPITDAESEVVGIITSKSATKGNRTLRGITLSYIDRMLRSQTALPLATILSGDPAVHASRMPASLSPELIKVITDSLLKKK